MQILHWPIDAALEKETKEHYRTRFAHDLQKETPLEIIRQITFDGVAPEITVPDIRKLIEYVVKNFLPRLSGQGLEVGAGPGTFSSVLASFDKVEKVYSIEVCPPIVELLAPKVSDFILGKETHKVVGVIGDFDHIQLSDASLDFIFDYYSLHHSPDINVTLKECARVLKPGGFVLCFDKARPDHYTQEDLSKLLDAEYPDDHKEKLFGVPVGQKFTRRMNGEKEYRLKDWKAAFLGAGFKRFEHFHFAKTIGGSSVTRVLKKFLVLLPARVQARLTRFMPQKPRRHIFLLADSNRVFVPDINKFPKEFSLMIAYR